ncbi:hypothetical protein GCK32_020704, partial [Trichostrongylus colubriformis]
MKKVTPGSNPELFMTDDTNSFSNGFQKIPISGGPSLDPPIRKFHTRASQKKKQDTREEPPPLSPYQPDDLNSCAVCLRQDPRNPSSEESTTWLKYNSCKIWAMKTERVMRALNALLHE